MKLETKPIPEDMKNTIRGVSSTEEKNSLNILDELKKEEDLRNKDNKRVTFFVNLIYIIGLILLIILYFSSMSYLILSVLALLTIGTFVFNIFIYNETLRTKKNKKEIEEFFKSNINK